jgi:hypothetical protein
MVFLVLARLLSSMGYLYCFISYQTIVGKNAFEFILLSVKQCHTSYAPGPGMSSIGGFQRNPLVNLMKGGFICFEFA